MKRRFWILGTSAVAALSVVTACAAHQDDTSTGGTAQDFTEQQIDCEGNPLSSFDRVKASIYESGGEFQNTVFASGTMPIRGNPAAAAVNALTGGFSHDASQILQCSRDYRANPNNADKIIHAPGICASATWEMTDGATGIDRNMASARRPYTGLFAPGTRVNAIVRLSSGTNVAQPNGRLPKPSWGIAVKLFATDIQQTAEPTRTAQIVMFDQNGVDGTVSPEMLRSEDPSQPHFFSNWMFGDGLFAKASIDIFNRFVQPHTQLGKTIVRQARLQALDEVARITTDGSDVPIASAHYPTVMKIQLADETPPLASVASRAPAGVDLSQDFRDQLLAYQDREIVFDVIGDNDAQGPQAVRTAGADHRIGRLTLDHMAVSDVCDRRLTFQHRRNGEVFSGWQPGEAGE